MSEPQPRSFAPEEATVGSVLAAARAERGLAIAEVAQRLKFSPRQIEALEGDRYEALPGAPIVRGMVRSYAKLLGIDAAPLLDSIERTLVAGEIEMQPPDMSVPFPAERPSTSRVYVLLSMLIVLAAAVVLAEWFIRSQGAAAPDEASPHVAEPLASPDVSAPTAPEPEQSAPLPAPPAVDAGEGPPVASPARASSPSAARPLAPVSPRRGRVEFTCERESWVEIRDGTGEVIFSALNAAGSRRVVQGAVPLTMVIGNASGVQLSFNNAPVDLAPHTRVDVARITLE